MVRRHVVAGLALTAILAGCIGPASQAPASPASPNPTATAAPSPTPTVAPSASTATPSATPRPTAGSSPAAGAVWIQGTHVALVPPDGFVPATTFTGFEQASTGASIVVTEIPGPARTMIDGFTDAGLAGQGITVATREEVTVGGLEGLLIQGTQRTGGLTVGKLALVTGTDQLTALLNGNYPESDSATGDRIRASLLTTVVDPDRDIDAEAALPFTFEPAPPLQFATGLVNAGLYNTSGTLPPADQLEPNLIVAPSLAGPVPGDVEDFARARANSMPGVTDFEIEGEDAFDVGEMDGIEIFGPGVDDDGGGELFLWHLLLTDETTYVLMSGKCRAAEADTCLDVFRRSAASYRPKPGG